MAFKEKNNLYEFIDKKPVLTVNELSKKMNFSRRKINRYMKKLVKDGV